MQYALYIDFQIICNIFYLFPKIFSPFILKSLNEEIILIDTEESMVGILTPKSIALCDVHFPVPFCFALSKITSIKSLPVSPSLA